MNIYEIITTCICARLAQGVAPWHRPWSGGDLPKNLCSHHPYRGVNVWLLAAQPYASPYWATYRQVQARGGHIRRDEHGTPIVFWKAPDPGDEPDAAATQAEKKRQAPVLRYSLVWNTEQCELPPSVMEQLRASLPTPGDPIPACEQIIRHMPHRPVIMHGGAQAVYHPRLDRITMPFPVRFERPEDYFSTLRHEVCHATGHGSRLGRPSLQGPCSFGSAPYCHEELLAEMGAAFVCGVAGIAPAIIENSAAYLQFWLQQLRAHPRLLLTIATQAQKAADYILNRLAPAASCAGDGEGKTQNAALS